MPNPLLRLIQKLHPSKPQALPVPDAKLALGALLVRVARADNTYVFEEISQIDRILAKQNGINAVQAAKMRAVCEKLEKATPDTPIFAQLIREHVSYDERLETVEALWQVVEADGIRKVQEEDFVDLIENLLGIEAEHSSAAREAARSIP